MPDEFNLQRFVAIQTRVIEEVRAELQAGVKRSHWMWFVFPQIAGLGVSAMSKRYAISGRAEAAACLQHPVLGPRLVELTEIINALPNVSASQIFGGIDAQKFQSSMTLFAAISDGATVFEAALVKYFGGETDPRTLAML